MTPVPVASTIQTEVSVATYAAGSEQRNAYDYLNGQRMACGFGLLQQESRLDTAAQGHANYLSVNHLSSHIQDKSAYPNAFTGATVNDRFVAAGYIATTGAEVLTEPFPYSFYQSYGATYGQSAVMDLFASPYHGNGMLDGERDVGIGHADISSFWRRVVINIGSTTQRPRQQISGDQVLTYPCAASNSVLSKTYTDEVPSPIPGRNLVGNPIGHPIYVKVRDGNILVLSNYVLRKTGTAVDIPMQILNKGNDTNGKILDQSVAILMPLAPLDKNSKYEFKSEGTNNEKPVSISFVFSTLGY